MMTDISERLQRMRAADALAPDLLTAAHAVWSLLDEARSRNARFLGQPLREAHEQLGAAIRKASGQ